MYMCAMGVDFVRFYDYTCNWILKLSYGMEMFAFFILLPKKFMPYQIQNKIECINDCSYVDAIIE